jgi:hypothetical protein
LIPAAPTNKQKEKEVYMESQLPLSKWKVNSGQPILHSKHNLKKKKLSLQPPPTRKKKEATSLHSIT